MEWGDVNLGVSEPDKLLITAVTACYDRLVDPAADADLVG